MKLRYTTSLSIQPVELVHANGLQIGAPVHRHQKAGSVVQAVGQMGVYVCMCLVPLNDVGEERSQNILVFWSKNRPNFSDGCPFGLL